MYQHSVFRCASSCPAAYAGLGCTCTDRFSDASRNFTSSGNPPEADSPIPPIRSRAHSVTALCRFLPFISPPVIPERASPPPPPEVEVAARSASSQLSPTFFPSSTFFPNFDRSEEHTPELQSRGLT